MTVKRAQTLIGAHFNISDARANLSELVQRAAAGEEIVIAKAGEPQAKLVPVEPLKERPAGTLAHLFTQDELGELDRYIKESTDKEEDWSEFYGTSDAST